jgi:hypothetical protein
MGRKIKVIGIGPAPMQAPRLPCRRHPATRTYELNGEMIQRFPTERILEVVELPLAVPADRPPPRRYPVTRNEILHDIPRLKEILPNTKIHLWENFFFTADRQRPYDRHPELAERISRISRGRKTRLLSANADHIGKVGEFVPSRSSAPVPR